MYHTCQIAKLDPQVRAETAFSAMPRGRMYLYIEAEAVTFAALVATLKGICI